MEKPALSWTMYGPLEDETSVSDPLAFDYFAQQLGNVILPSFTTRTSRARYYSMVAYGLEISRRYAAKHSSTYHTKEVLDAFTLFEKLWARAVVENYNGKLIERDNQETGFRGKRGAINAYKSGINTLDFHFLRRQLDLGGLGAYRTSMEDLELIRNDLSLTNLGRDIAREFLPKYYDDFIIEAIESAAKGKRIPLSRGKASLKSLGYHGMLDLWSHNSFDHKEERNLLKAAVIENQKNIVAISYIVKENDKLIGNGKPQQIIENVCRRKGRTTCGKNVILGFNTILAFEKLSTALTNIWCEIILSAFENVGRINIDDCVNKISEDLDSLCSKGLISNLISTAGYRYICGSLHGSEFDCFIRKYISMDKSMYKHFVYELIEYHNQVMAKRSGSWILSDRNEIIVISGYEYAKSNHKKQWIHNYKIDNIKQLVYDTGWIDNGRAY